jgi:hypothetical protein
MYALSLYGMEMETKEKVMTHHLGRGIYIITLFWIMTGLHPALAINVYS